jgi:two-component system response regulator (stage 0 sporulation protein F)
LKILIIDEIEVALLFQESLERQGHVVTVAASGAEALARLRQFRPDAVFLELRLPGMSGVEVLRRIRSIDPQLPVVIITGWAVRQEIEEARRFGVTDIVEKPEMVKELRVILERLKNISLHRWDRSDRN